MRNIFILMVMVIFVSACDQRAEEVRHYQEVVIQPPLPSMGGVDSHAHMATPPNMSVSPMSGKPSVSWQAPEGWNEAKGSSMRLVTFSAKDSANPIDCSIVSLGKKAGSFEANVVRWMKQINLQIVDKNQFDAFLDKSKRLTTKNGIPTTVVDFTILQGADEMNFSSMMAGIMEFEDKTVFVKMTGSKGAILKNKASFHTLLESIQQVK